MTSILAALPVQYSPDGNGATPVVANGGAFLRRTASPGQPGVKARSRSSLSLVSHGDDRSSSITAADRAHDGLQLQGSTAADSQTGTPEAGSLQLSSALAGGTGASVDASPTRRAHSVRRLSPFAADDAQDDVVASVDAVRRHSNLSETA
jgi:hypothetical protein